MSGPCEMRERQKDRKIERARESEGLTSTCISFHEKLGLR